MKILPKREFQKFIYEKGLSEGMTPEDSALEAITTVGIQLNKEGEIIVREGLSTKKRLHELGHREFGRQKIITNIGDTTVGDVAYSEILAEKFAWEKMGKKVTYRVGYPALWSLIYDEKMSPGEAVGVVIQVLEQYMGITVPTSGKRELHRMAWKHRRVV